ncbi:MAG TPA: exodeoxyribonuclease VII small subunit [Planctomycetota bacterium]|nr:exodeoxyribonuclease VII small subunit [Planctomycetota bacterium]
MAAKAKSAAGPSGEEKTRSFEQHLGDLEGVVAELEKGDLPLEESIERYRKGLASLRSCYEILQKAQRQVEELTRDVRGALSTRPFEAPEGEGSPGAGA